MYDLSTGNLPLGILSRNILARIFDFPEMTIAVEHGCKALNQTYLTKQMVR